MTAEWVAVRHPPPLALGEVHVWFAEIDLEHAGHWEKELSAEENARAKRFLDTKARNAYIGSHSLLRTLIARYRGISPGDVKFSAASSGKPVLPDTNLHFSLSHSADAALLAFAADTELGVDIERIDITSIDVGVAERIFTPDELRTLKAHEDRERVLAFSRGWTRKEAYAKCCGTGLDDLNRVQTGILENNAFVEGITIRTFRCAEHLIGSLATRGKAKSVEFLKWSS